MNTNQEIENSVLRPHVLIGQSNREDLAKIASASDKLNKYDYVVATTGREIIDTLNQGCFDEVVIGLKFPDVTGATIAYLIREVSPKIPIVFLTHYPKDILVSAAQNISCEFIDKHVAMKDLTYLCNRIYEIAFNDKKSKADTMTKVLSHAAETAKIFLPNSLEKISKAREA